MTILAFVPPLAPHAARVRKPNRRPGSCPSQVVTDLRPRQFAPLSERALTVGDALVADNPAFAAELAAAIELALLQVPS